MDQVAAEQVREQLLASRIAASKRLSLQQQRRILGLIAGAVVGLCLLLLLLGVLYGRSYDGRIFRGVAVAGVSVAGLTPEEAQAKVDAQVEIWLATPLTTQTKSGDYRWQIAPTDLGVQLNTGAAVANAYAVGHAGNPLGNVFDWFGALFGRQVPIPSTLSDDQLDQALHAWAPQATYQPTNAAFGVNDGGKLIIVADVNGLGFDFNSSRAALLDEISRLGTKPVTLAQVAVSAPINQAMLEQVNQQAQAVAAQPLVVHSTDQTWTMDQPTLAAAVAYTLVDGKLTLALNPTRVQPFFATISKVVDKPGGNAKIVLDNNGKYTITPAKEGIGLDEAASLATINAALSGGSHEANLTITQQLPAILGSDLEPIRARLETIVNTPVAIRVDGFKTRTLVKADIQPLIRLVEQPTQPEKVAITLDDAGVKALVQVLAGEINQPVKDAKFRFVNTTIQDVEKSQDGREVQYAGTTTALREAILGATGSATPVITVTKPKVPSSQKAQMLTPNLLGVGRTNYVISIPTRKHNVELAVERLNGTIIAPGAQFSFNAAVGAQTVENGYEEAYGIQLVPGANGGKGEVKTVSSIAGGICQVSTTLFHSVFKAGLPIEERNWHLFWVPYAASSTGYQGLDATVDDQADLDFRWWNNTGGWLGIEAYADGEVVYVNVYGKNPGWNVKIDGPEISNIIEPDPVPVYEKTHDLPVGSEQMIEHKADGFTAAIRRQVFDSKGNLVQFNGKGMDTTFKSNYLPSRDRYQVGVPKNQPLD